MNKINVGYDLDGVCYDFGSSVIEYLKSINHPSTNCKDFGTITHWYFYRDWGIDDKEFVQLCNDGVDAGIVFTYGKPHTGAVEAMNELFYLGYNIVIVTDRSFGSDTGKNSRKATYQFLAGNEFQWDQIYFTADKTMVSLDTMIDDKVENFLELSAHGVDCYLLDQPWNRHISAGSKRIYSLNEYVRIIKAKYPIGVGV